jgi:chromosome segregation ATPase
LKSEVDAATLDAANDGKRKVLVTQVKERRIVQRREATIEVARELCNGDWHAPVANGVNFRNQILDLNQQADHLQRLVCRSLEAKGEASSIVTEIKEALKIFSQQHEDCKAQKNEVHKPLQQKKAALAKALQQLFEADLDYTNTYCEHEALRMQSENLKQCISRTEEQKTAAEAAAQSALDACEEWQNAASESEQQLRERISAQVDVCQSSIMVPTQAAALNIQLAQKIVTSASRETEVEISSIQKDQEEKNRQHSTVEDEMGAEEPERDIDDIEYDLGKVKEQEKALRESLGKANEMKTRLQAELGSSTESFKTLKGFFGSDQKLAQFFEASDVEKKASQGAFELANESYKDYNLFKKGTVIQRPAPAATSGALVAMDANMKAWIEQMIDQKAEEKANAKLDQLRAEMMLGRQAGSATSSEAGDWMQVPATAEVSDAEGS